MFSEMFSRYFASLKQMFSTDFKNLILNPIFLEPFEGLRLQDRPVVPTGVSEAKLASLLKGVGKCCTIAFRVLKKCDCNT